MSHSSKLGSDLGLYCLLLRGELVFTDVLPVKLFLCATCCHLPEIFFLNCLPVANALLAGCLPHYAILCQMQSTRKKLCDPPTQPVVSAFGSTCGLPEPGTTANKMFRSHLKQSMKKQIQSSFDSRRVLKGFASVVSSHILSALSYEAALLPLWLQIDQCKTGVAVAQQGLGML